MYQTADEENTRAGAAGTGGMTGGMETLIREGMSGPYARQFAGL